MRELVDDVPRAQAQRRALQDLRRPHGGPNNQVLDDDGREIEGLYACGAVTRLSYASCSTVAATGYYVGETLAAK